MNKIINSKLCRISKSAIPVTGITAIDDDHQLLVSLYNKFISSFSDNKNNHQQSLMFLADFSEFSKDHFRREEALMASVSYDHFIRHKTCHDTFANTLSTMLKQFGTEHVSMAMAGDFLYKWIDVHLNTEDVGASCIIHDETDFRTT